MGAVSNFLDFKDHRDAPTLVLVDLHGDPPLPSDLGPQDFLIALERCRAALECARRHDLPVAFVRQMTPSPSFLANRVCPSWLADIRPRRTDMVFERASPSCYGSTEFTQMARCAGELVLAGLFGETSCLATLMEGYNRNQVFTYLSDASVSRGVGEVPSRDMHRSVTGIASIYSHIASSDAWIERVSHKADAVR